jgi:hypothetical protein
MPKIIGKVVKDENGVLCLEMSLGSSDNLEKVPLSDIFEDYVGSRIAFEILKMAPPKEQRGGQKK